MSIDPTNRNTLWASILVDELTRNGVKHAVISPGSRSTPLTVAFSRDERIRVHSVLDERSAAFFALGIGMATRRPAVLVCTSGTAAANYYPAIIEANQSNVPLIAMTADRPHDLRGSGANQTIDQTKMYGDHVRWFVDVALPEANPPDRVLRYLRTTICRAVVASSDGPVHLNLPFRKPLEPTPVEDDVPAAVLEGIGAQGRADGEQFFTQALFQPHGVHWQGYIKGLAEQIAQAKHGVISLGKLAKNRLDDTSLEFFSRDTGYPILVEAVSRERFKKHERQGTWLTGYETYLHGETAKAFAPELIIQIGAAPVSKSLLEYMVEYDNVPKIVLTDTDGYYDGNHSTSHIAYVEIDELLYDILEHLELYYDIKPVVTWYEQFRRAEEIVWEVLSTATPNEGNLLKDIAAQADIVFAASSNPVRHLEQFVPSLGKDIDVYSSRGASGIDGTVASALGVIAGYGGYVTDKSVLIIGDVALYHDMNSLHLIRRLGIPLIIVCINNDGGGIFHRLPIAKHDPPFSEHFITPHGLTFEHAAHMFGIPYTRAEPGEPFREAYRAALVSGDAHLIEVPSDAAEFERQRRALMAEVQRRIKAAGLLD